MTGGVPQPLDVRNAAAVSVRRDPACAAYPPPAAAPFHPGERYPEYAGPLADTPNAVYALVRHALADLGLDRARFGTPQWNPIGDVVAPGSKIVVKPNWVLHRNEGPAGTDCLIAHASVVRAVLDYALLARPREVVVGDAPVQVCDFAGVQALGFASVADYLRRSGAPLAVRDFRRTTMERSDRAARVHEDLKPADDFVLVDLGTRSLLEAIAGDCEKFRVTMYDPRRMKVNHRPGLHRYLIARDVLEADLVINVPKLKTHKKAGMTAALKNLVGINGNKDFLPHHRRGAADRGGDNYARATVPKYLAEATLDLANRHLHWPRFYARASRFAYRFLFFDRIRGLPMDIEGGWYGNDTVWRMCLDLNKVLLYADARGNLRERPQRAVLSVTDGVIAGDGDGPLRPDARPFGAILAACNPAAHDWVASIIMGYDPERIPIVARAWGSDDLPLADFDPSRIDAILNGRSVRANELAAAFPDTFNSPHGWRGRIERAAPAAGLPASG